jgi:hypothetical protein
MRSIFGRMPEKNGRRFVPAPATVISIVALFVALGGGAYAVSGKIGSQDIAKKAIKPKHFSKKAEDFIRSLVAQGAPGTAGSPGAAGPQGPEGAQGQATAAQYVGEEWGVIARNTIGSAVADLRSGPFNSAPSGNAPPFGEGSLGIAVSNNSMSGGTPQEKASFGNEVDFLGDPVLDLTEVGFHVFQTGENNAVSNRNLPNITFEIDSNLASLSNPNDNFTSLVWVPGPVPVVDRWSGYRDATTDGNWYMTGEEGSDTGCTVSLTCDFDDVMTALDDGGAEPVIGTAAVTKGRDNAWVGAVDGLVINDTGYDFEPFGVQEFTP